MSCGPCPRGRRKGQGPGEAPLGHNRAHEGPLLGGRTMGFYIFWLVSRMAHIQIAPSQNFLQIYHRIQKKSYKFAKNRLFCVCGVLGHDASVEAACKKMKLPLPSASLTGTVLVSLVPNPFGGAWRPRSHRCPVPPAASRRHRPLPPSLNLCPTPDARYANAPSSHKLISRVGLPVDLA